MSDYLGTIVGGEQRSSLQVRPRLVTPFEGSLHEPSIPVQNNQNHSVELSGPQFEKRNLLPSAPVNFERLNHLDSLDRPSPAQNVSKAVGRAETRDEPNRLSAEFREESFEPAKGPAEAPNSHGLFRIITNTTTSSSAFPKAEGLLPDAGAVSPKRELRESQRRDILDGDVTTNPKVKATDPIVFASVVSPLLNRADSGVPVSSKGSASKDRPSEQSSPPPPQPIRPRFADPPRVAPERSPFSALNDLDFRTTSGPPVIQVTIGRVEVRANVAGTEKQRRVAVPSKVLSLDEYLRKRSGGGER